MMGRNGSARVRTARRSRGEERLDPVRWRRPGRGPLIRLAVVAVLLATAAAASWSRPATCAPATTATHTAPATTTPSGRPGVPTGSVGVPVRLADPTALSLVHPGNRVDLLRLSHDSAGPTPVAAAALVLGVTGAGDPTSGGLLLALTPEEAHEAVVPSPDGYAVVIRPG